MDRTYRITFFNLDHLMLLRGYFEYAMYSKNLKCGSIMNDSLNDHWSAHLLC